MRAFSYAMKLRSVSQKAKLVAIKLGEGASSRTVWRTTKALSEFAMCSKPYIQTACEQLVCCGFLKKFRISDGVVSVHFGFFVDEDQVDGAAIAHLNDTDLCANRGKSKEKIPIELRQAVYQRDGHKCLQCGDRTNLSMDHIVAECFGGPTSFENLQTLCKSCNLKKGVAYVDYRRIV